MNENKLIIISGPTSSGKTATSFLIYDQIQNELLKDCAIVNFDSLLFYKELSIGTAKPTQEELEKYDHHLINIASIEDSLNASDFITKAKVVIQKLFAQSKVVILVGGSAFYIRAFMKGMYSGPTIDQELRRSINQLYKDQGISPIRSFLTEHDPQSLIDLHENDHYRLIRAYEFYKQTSGPISSQKKRYDKNLPYDFSINDHPLVDFLHIYLDLPKDQHFEYIKKRTRSMVDQGLIDEVREILKKSSSDKLKPLLSIGYKETSQHLAGGFSSIDAYIDRIDISTRQLAKSQRTFFKKITPKFSFNPLEDKHEMCEKIIEFLKK